ncbi:MAG: heme NO-binding domain-containing protein [Acidiferrobacterales bacterium]|nr:heme NO-binding domain-containing protein [Acidiferrobacterales bacterium]
MLGVIFTSLIEMMEQEVGLEATEEVLDKAQVESGACYTAVGFYPPEELVSIVTHLSQQTGIPIPDLVQQFGFYLFDLLATSHPHAVEGKTSVIELLSQLDSHIHVEVKKLYPEANLPAFKTIEESDSHIKLLYISTNRLEPLAEGLIKGGADYFNENVVIRITPADEHSSYIEVNKATS